jgi:hypothetical protein
VHTQRSETLLNEFGRAHPVRFRPSPSQHRLTTRPTTADESAELAIEDDEVASSERELVRGDDG